MKCVGISTDTVPMFDGTSNIKLLKTSTSQDVLLTLKLSLLVSSTMQCQAHQGDSDAAENLVDIIHYNGKEMVDTRHTVAEIAGQPPQPVSSSKQQHGNGTHC